MEAISGGGKAIPPLLIIAGKVYLEHWYRANLPGDYLLAVSDIGYINNQLGLAWIRYFDAKTRTGCP